jgi:hypothetical protein
MKRKHLRIILWRYTVISPEGLGKITKTLIKIVTVLVKVGAGNLLNARQEICSLNQLARRDKMMNSEQRRICKDVVLVCLKVVQCLP